ncbi:hypothetical protein Tco_1577359 [Tanacetum coccineum]
MAQHVFLAAQLVPQYKPIRRCNNYAVLQSIPCSPKCKIVGLILLDHCLSHVLTTIADVPAVYLQQFWRTVSKDDIPLVSVYTTGNVLVRGMLIPDAFLTVEIRETDDFKEYETVFMKESFPMNHLTTLFSTPLNEYGKSPIAHKDDDDSKDRIEPGSHKDNPEFVVDDDDKPKEEAMMIRVVWEDDFHSQHDEHQDDDAPPEGEKRAKRGKGSKRSKSIRGSLSKNSTKYVSKQQSQQQEWDAWEEDNVINKDEVIPEDETLELIAEFRNVEKQVPTIFDRAIIEATLRDSLSNQSRNATEYTYHLKQSTKFMEN